jgi:hypothetical protein
MVQVHGQEGLLFVNKKKQKNFDFLWALAMSLQRPAETKVFWFFFSKKNRFPSAEKMDCFAWREMTNKGLISIVAQ